MTKDGELLIDPPFNLYAGRDTSIYAITDFGESRTNQEFVDDVDINKIMARYVKTGTVPVYADRQPFYVDAVDYPSFQDMQNIMISARDAFLALPASVRERFHNDPAKFVEFAVNDENAAELKKLGLLSPEAVERLDKIEADQALENAEALLKSKKPAEPPSKAE